MSYQEILRAGIVARGMSLLDIFAECRGLGVRVTPAYISRLQNGKRAPASDKINKALAQVLGLDAQELRLAAYAERIPPDILAQLAEKTNHSRQP